MDVDEWLDEWYVKLHCPDCGWGFWGIDAESAERMLRQHKKRNQCLKLESRSEQGLR